MNTKIPTKLLSLVAAASLAASASFAQTTTVTSDTVGYVSIDIKGGSSTSLVSNAGLIQPSEASGNGTVSSGTTLTSTGASWTADAFAGTHYIILDSGEWSAITSNTSDTLTLDSALSDGADQGFSIHKLNTLDILFGATNSAGFTGGSNLGVSDIIAPWESSIQNFSGFYYYNTDRSRWEDASNNSAGSTIVYPDESLVVIAQSDAKIVISGTVQTGNTSGEVAGGGGTSIVPNPYPVDLKISESGYESVLQGGSNFGVADWALIWDRDTQNFSKFFYYNTNANEWQDASNNPATDTDVIPAGGAVVFVKNSAGIGEWSLAQTY